MNPCYLPLFYSGGALLPPSRSEIIAWLSGGTDDGVELLDKIVVDALDPFEIRDVNCLTSTGAQTISNANIQNGATITNEGTATGVATAGVITFSSGTISQVSIDGTLTYVCEEGSGFPYDVTGSENHITAMTTTWTTSDAIPCYNMTDGFSPFNSLYTVTEPSGGWDDRTFNANTATTGELMDLIATMIYDVKNTIGTYTITVTPLTTFNPNTATLGNAFDVAGTLASELGGSYSTYTITEPSGGWIRTFNPNTATVGEMADVLATLVHDILVIDSYIPALSDGSADALGNEITNPAGLTNNDFEGTLIATDTSLLTAVDSFWVEAGAFVKRSLADFKARLNLTQSQVDQFTADCLLKDCVIYDEDTVKDESWVNRATRWAERFNDSCSDTAVPYLLGDGTPYLLDDGSVYLIDPN
jgi:hypothetical protein